MPTGYYTSPQGREDDRVEYRRVPDNGLYTRIMQSSCPTKTITNGSTITDRHFVTTTTSPSGKVKVTQQQQGRYDPQEPRTVDARYEDYERERAQRRAAKKHGHSKQ